MAYPSNMNASDLFEQLLSKGLEGLPQLLSSIIEALKLQRSHYEYLLSFVHESYQFKVFLIITLPEFLVAL